jgi:hypothetical protein
VRKRDGDLLAEIQRDALDSKVKVADVLRKLVALGGEAGSVELREWASLELRGYAGSDVELPDYRRPPAAIQIDGANPGARFSGQQISPRSLPDGIAEHVREEVPLNHSIGEIEAMREQAAAKGGHIRLSLPSSSDVAALMNDEIGDPYQQITAVYWSVSEAALSGVIDRVRTTLVELVAEMRAGMPASADAPSAAVADQAVSVVVHGRGARVNVTSAHASGSGSHEVQAAPVPEADRSRWKTVGALVVGTATLIGALIALAEWQGWGP